MTVDWGELAPWLIAAAGLILLSGFFAGSEVALFGLRRVEREQLARSGRAVDDVVLRLLAQPRRLVTSVLLGSEAVNMTLAAVGVVVFGELVPEAATPALIALVVAVAAPIVLLVGVVVPRTLAIKAPIAWARTAARPLALFALVLWPVRWVVQTVVEGLAKAFGSGGRSRGAGDLSEEEFRKLVDAGSAQGQVDARERRLIHKVFEFGDKNVGQIMTPRDKVFALAYDLPMARLAKEIAARGFSRVPIYQRSLDNIRGILNAKDLVLATAGQAPARTLSELLHEPLFVPRTTPLARLFRTFKQKKVHMAMVVNEYGKVLGLVTMDDLLAQLFGAIRDEREGQQKAALRRGRGGRTPVPGSMPAVSDGGGPVEVQEMTPPPIDPSELTPPPVDVPGEAGGPRHARATTHDDDDDDDDVERAASP
ncbi:MAG TPA: hemolysin family protein, partial [Kofleriaceae bacterium]|nr:hemolysin family protein [Kofleriaceae bacterium]